MFFQMSMSVCHSEILLLFLGIKFEIHHFILSPTRFYHDDHLILYHILITFSISFHLICLFYIIWLIYYKSIYFIIFEPAHAFKLKSPTQVYSISYRLHFSISFDLICILYIIGLIYYKSIYFIILKSAYALEIKSPTQVCTIYRFVFW